MSANVIDAASARAMLERGEALAVDCRHQLVDPAQGARDYALAHIPGAVHAHLDRDLSDLGRTGEGRHPLPDDAAFSAFLSRAGIERDTWVIAYDDAGGAIAARLWWMLRAAGHERVAVLDGGLAAWRAAGYLLDAAVPERRPTDYRVRIDRDAFVTPEALRASMAAGTATLVDARAAERYRGENETIDRVAGHVPGAHSRPFAGNLDADGCFKPPAQLREEWLAALGGASPRQVLHMCGSGVTACHNLLAMEHAGLTGSRLFAASWSGWIADPQRPIATGPEPGG